jgi:hypothetical protein
MSRPFFWLVALFVAAGPGHAADESRSLIRVQASVLVNRPPAEVFDFVSDAENDKRWRTEVVRINNLTPNARGVGARTLEVASVLGKELRTTTEVVEFVPGERTGRRTVSSPTPVATLRTVVAQGGGALFTYSLESDVSGEFWFRALRPVIQWWYQRKVERYMAVLKQVLEGGDNRQR